MDAKHRETLGERLANRLSSRSRRRPRMAMDASFYGRFGLADPWSAPEVEGEAEASDGMVFLSGAPFHAMMRRLANARRRRARREEHFFARRAGTTLRAATRRRAGEAEGVVALRSARMGGQSAAEFVLPPPISASAVASDIPGEGGVVALRPAYQAMRPVASPWYTTPFVPARVMRGGETHLSPTVATGAAGNIAPPRPLARVGERLQVAASPLSEPVRVAGQLPLRIRRAIASVFVDELPADMPVIEIVRVLRRVGAPSAIIREVVELAPATGSVSSAARRMPVGVSPQATGLRAVLARSPAMALAASPESDRAASGTLAEAERSAAHTGAARPRAAVRTSTRLLGRSAVPDVGASLSSSPVARASAGRPAALRAVPARAAAEAGGSGFAVESAVVPVAVNARAISASANAMSRAAASPPSGRRAMARFDGASWAFVRADVRAADPELANPSVLPDVVPGRPRAVVPRSGSAVRPVEGRVARFVPARIAAATGSLTLTGRQPVASSPVGSPVARPLRRQGRGAAVVRPDRGASELLFPPAGASPVQQAFARLTAGQDVPVGSPASSIVPHPTPRLDRPVRAALALSTGAFTSVRTSLAADGSPSATSGSTSETPGDASRGVRGSGSPLRRSSALKSDESGSLPGSGAGSGIESRSTRRVESASRTAARRVSGLRVATTEVVRSAANSAHEGAPEAASGPMAWAPSTRFALPAGSGAALSRPALRGPGRIGARAAQASNVQQADLVGSSPVREPSGRFVAVRSAVRKAAESAMPVRFGAMAAGRVDVIYVSAGGVVSPSDAGGANAVPVDAPARSLVWAASRSNIHRATAYRGAIADGGSLAAQRQILAESPSRRLGESEGSPIRRTLAGSAADSVEMSVPATGARRASRGAPPAEALRPGRRTLPKDAFVPASGPSFGFEADTEAPVSRACRAVESDASVAAPRPVGRSPVGRSLVGRSPVVRPPLDRRLHDLATGGSGVGADAPVWNARAEGAPRVRSVHGLFESLARATTAEQVVHVLFARADGLLAAPAGVPAGVAAPIQQVIQEIRQEVARPIAMAASDEAALPTRPTRLSAPVAEQLRPQGGSSRQSAGARVSRGTTRPVVSRARSIGSGSEDRIMKLVKKLQGLIHLAEAENRLSEAQRQVRMAEDSEDARAEGGQGARAGGQAGSSKDSSKVDIEQLGREVLEVVTRELEFRRERRMEDHDESVWW